MTRNRIILLGLLALGGVGMLLARWLQIVPPGSDKALVLSQHGLSVAKSLDTLIAEADVIVDASVISIGPARWNTPDGRMPESINAAESPPGPIPFKDAELNVQRVLKGSIPEGVLLVRTFGGTLGQVSPMIDGGEDLRAGKEYILFLMDDAGPTAEIAPAHFVLSAPLPQNLVVANGRATSATEDWAHEDLARHIEAVAVAGDSSGVAQYLSQRCAELGIPLLSVNATGSYVEVILHVQSKDEVQSPEHRFHRHLVRREIELARLKGYVIGSWSMAAATDANVRRFALVYGDTQPDDALWLDDYPTRISDAAIANLLQDQLNTGGMSLAGVEVTSSEGLQSVTLLLMAQSGADASEDTQNVLEAVQLILEGANAQGAHVVEFRAKVTEAGGELLLDYVYDFRTDLFSRWQSPSMPYDWTAP